MLKADVHPKVSPENLGHSTITMTLDTYSHVAPGIKEAVAQKLNGIFQIKKPLQSHN
jgi:integrase